MNAVLRKDHAQSNRHEAPHVCARMSGVRGRGSRHGGASRFVPLYCHQLEGEPVATGGDDALSCAHTSRLLSHQVRST
jgi:hypothetical protein